MKTLFSTAWFCVLVTLASLSSIPQARASDWVAAKQEGSTAYFFVSFPASIQRYDLASRSWLSPIVFPAARGPMTTATVDSSGIVVAYDKAVFRYGINGLGEQHLVNSGSAVQSLHTDGNLLLINHSDGLYAQIISINLTTNQVIASFSNYIDSVFGAAGAPSLNRIFGSREGISPDDVTYVEYRDDGTFVGGGDSTHHGDYPSSSRVWVFPDEGRFVDDSGTVYSTGSLSYSGSFGSGIEDVVFHGGSVPIVLFGNRISSYTNSLLLAGNIDLQVTPKKLFLNGGDVLAFVPTAPGDEIGAFAIPLSDLQAPQPGAVVDANGLPYTPDEVFFDGADLLYIASYAQQSIFRWQISTQRYLPAIPLIGVPDRVAYSQSSGRIYLAYSTGLIRKIDLQDPDFTEVPFANLPQKSSGLSTAGDYLFAVDASGAWATHYTFDLNGNMISSVDWNYYSKNYVWNEIRQKMYFFRDDTSPNDLIWEEINANGTAYPALLPGAIGMTKDSPLHTSVGFIHPIRLSLDGTVVLLGSGFLHNAETLERLTPALGNAVTDAAWSDAALFSVRTIADLTQIQTWSLTTFGQVLSLQVPGSAIRIIRLSDQKLVSLSIAADGIPSFYIVSNNLSILPPAQFLPPAVPVGTIQGDDRILLTWQDVSGETGYNIERKTQPGGSWSMLGTTATSATGYTDLTVAAGNIYQYRVSAKNGAIVSAPSVAVEINFTAPDAPVLSGSIVSSSRIQLDWSSVERATFYDIYRRLGSSGSFQLVETIAAGILTHADISLASNTTYEYYIRSRNALGSSPESAHLSFTTPRVPPPAPFLNVPSASGPYSVSLRWSNVVDEDSYQIERKQGTGAWAVIATPSFDVTSYSDLTVDRATQYSYRVFAQNSAGSSSASTVRTITTPDLPIPTIPGEPSGQAESATSIALRWSDSANESSYRIERTVGEDPWVTIAASLPANYITYVDNTVTNGTFYNYRVVAVNAKGEAPSATFTALAALTGAILQDDFDPGLDFTVWSSFSGASVTSGPTGFLDGNAFWFGGGAEAVRSASTVRVDVRNGGTIEFDFRAGNQALDGNTHWNNSEANEYVILEYSIEAGTWTPLTILDTQFPGHSAWERFSITLPTSARSATTSFRWRQLSFSGEALDTWALDNVNVRGILPPTPAPPGFILGAANSSRTVAISWAASNGANSYVIERRTPSSDWESVGTAAFQTFFTDSTAIPATLYSYRVRARNSGGNSMPSQTAFIRTWSVFEEWRFQNYGTLADQGSAASMADNGTGIPNIIRYAFNMAKDDAYFTVVAQGTAKGLPSIQFNDSEGRLHVAFIRRREERNPGLLYTVEFSGDLASWEAVGSVWYSVPISEDFEYVIWQDELLSPSARFGRVKVTE